MMIEEVADDADDCVDRYIVDLLKVCTYIANLTTSGVGRGDLLSRKYSSPYVASVAGIAEIK